MSDVYTNTIGNVMVVAPATQGVLAHIAQTRKVAFGEDVAVKEGLTRWVFADFPQGTLQDDWGNAYDHQVHSLLSGTLDEGRKRKTLRNGLCYRAGIRVVCAISKT